MEYFFISYDHRLYINPILENDPYNFFCKCIVNI